MLRELFLSSLKSGQLHASYCSKCGNYTWPVSPYCRFCRMGTELIPVSNKFGNLIEFCSVPDSKGQKVFGLVDIEGMKLIGTISVGNHKVRTNLTVKLVSCGVSSDASPYYEFEIV